MSSEVGGTVSVIDPVKHVVDAEDRFDVPGLRRRQIQPVGIRFTPDGKLAFVALGPANRVAVIDVGDARRSMKYLLVGQRVWQMAVHAGRQISLDRPTASPTTSRSSTSPALKVIKSIPVGSFPWGVAIAKQ